MRPISFQKFHIYTVEHYDQKSNTWCVSGSVDTHMDYIPFDLKFKDKEWTGLELYKDDFTGQISLHEFFRLLENSSLYEGFLNRVSEFVWATHYIQQALTDEIEINVGRIQVDEFCDRYYHFQLDHAKAMDLTLDIESADILAYISPFSEAGNITDAISDVQKETIVRKVLEQHKLKLITKKIHPNIEKWMG